jgi:hypothetical protein
MACDITSGRTEPCKNAVGGVKAAYFVPYIEDGFTVASGVVTGLDIGLTTAFKYILTSNTNKPVETMASSKENGTTVVTQEIALSLKKSGATTSNELKLVAHSRPIIVIQDNNDNYNVFGITDGCDLTSGVKEYGGEKSDFNGYNVTLSATETEYAPELDAATITAFLAKVSVTNIDPDA